MSAHCALHVGALRCVLHLGAPAESRRALSVHAQCAFGQDLRSTPS